MKNLFYLELLLLLLDYLGRLLRIGQEVVRLRVLGLRRILMGDIVRMWKNLKQSTRECKNTESPRVMEIGAL